MSDTIAAFFRLEGLLVPPSPLGAAAWMAARQQDATGRLARLAAVAGAVPLHWAPGGDRTLGTRLAWAGLRGCSRDRLEVLGFDYAEERLLPAVTPVGRRLVDAARREGQRVVLVSEGLDVYVEPLATALSIELVVCNRLELRDGRVTGRLEDPIFSGLLGGERLRAFAAQHGLDLTRSFAYGVHGADSTLLAAVGRPCTVNPDRQLRRVARDLDWPVITS